MNDPIEEALQTYPMAEVPKGFSKGVMKQVRLMPARRGFRLTWVDLALGLFLSVLPGLGFFIWAFLPQQFFIRLQYLWLVLRSPTYEPILLTILAITGLSVVLAAIASLGFVNRPQRISA
jgi:hypothetical protein